MKYVDYRTKLGIGLENSEKAAMLKNKIAVAFEKIKSQFKEMRGAGLYYDYFSEVGEVPTYPWRYDIDGVSHNITSSRNTNEYICKMVAFINVLKKRDLEPFYMYFKKVIFEALQNLKIPYEIFDDSEGTFIFPKGAQELDNALVSEPLGWLNAYPKTKKEWIDALKDYSNLTDANASDVADKFRKALERFFQEFFGSSKSLENMKSEYGAYMKTKGVPSEIRNNLETLLQSYTNFMNGYAKHHDKTGKNVLEYIMYQTGNVIRLLITLEKGA